MVATPDPSRSSCHDGDAGNHSTSPVGGVETSAMPDRSRPERLQIMLSEDELTGLDDFRFKKRMPSRAAAVRELMKRGLAAEGFVTAPSAPNPAITASSAKLRWDAADFVRRQDSRHAADRRGSMWRRSSPVVFPDPPRSAGASALSRYCPPRNQRPRRALPLRSHATDNCPVARGASCPMRDAEEPRVRRARDAAP